MNNWASRSAQRIGQSCVFFAALLLSIAMIGNAAAATAADEKAVDKGVALQGQDSSSRGVALRDGISASAGAMGALAHRPAGHGASDGDASDGRAGDALLGPFCTVSDCDGQPADSGGDSCDDATPFDLDMGDLQLVCGDSTPAGGQDEECGGLSPDYVWWESFTIDECADVLIDYCCTEPVPPTFYIVLSKDCPNCSLIFPETGDSCVDDLDCADRPYSHCSANAAGTFECRDFGFGDDGPRECAGGNPSAIWRNLGPGTYYYPLYTCTDPVTCNPVGTAGPYQLHINVLPPFGEPGGCCIPPQDEVTIVGVDSLKTHGLGGLELAIDLLDNAGIEPRRFGPSKLSFAMSNDMDGGTVHAGNVQIGCTLGPAPVVNSATLQGDRTVVVEISAMTDLDCCRFEFAGMQSIEGGGVISAFNVRAIQGDMNTSASVTGSDPLLVKPHFGEIAGVDLAHPKWDYDLSGGVTGSDFALIKPRLGNVGASCPALPAVAGVTCIETPCRDSCEALGGSFLGHGVPCAGANCLTGACCLDGGRRCELLSFENCIAQGGSFDGPGANCDPDCTCTPEGGGADACDELGDAVQIPIDGTVITFSGDTTLANDIDCPLLDPDLTWWEKIELDDCVNLRVDTCCTDPLLNVVYQVMYAECPCADFVVGSAQFGVVCDDGNADVLFTSAGPGTYYYPVHACVDAENCGLAISRLGPYQIHMRAEPAPIRACCLPDLDECQLLCPAYCRRLGGYPLVDTLECEGPNPCAMGSCCFGHNDCQETDLETCLTLGGSYSGGATCEDGACIVNDLCEDAVLVECNTVIDAYNQFATNNGEPGYSCHGAGVGTFGIGNVWFKFVASHHTARLHTCDSVPPADDSVLQIHQAGDPEDPCNTLMDIGCSDDVAGCIVQTGFGSDFVVDNLNIGETYYVQLGSWTEPDRGHYLLTILCPAVVGACCTEDNGQFTCHEGFEEQECDAIGGRYGGLDSVCGPPGDPQEMDPPCGDGACCRGDDLGFCTLLNQEDCESLCPECVWQGDGISCIDPMNPCAGSCCTGNGDACVTTTEAGCFDDFGGALWTRYLACDDPGIDCDNADPGLCTQPGSNCHLSDQQGHGFNDTLFVQSDRSQFTQSRVADSFVPMATPITSECWWGTYANFQQQNPNCTTGDAFRVTYYLADGPGGLPNSIIRQSNVSVTRSLTGNVFLNASGDIHPEWEYRGNNHPVANVTVGECAWFEVTNNTGFQNCRWYWATSGDGDGLSVNDANHINGYEIGEETTFDMAWCADVAIDDDDCSFSRQGRSQ